jgi:alpha-D-xyloside xylohydrolase
MDMICPIEIERYTRSRVAWKRAFWGAAGAAVLASCSTDEPAARPGAAGPSSSSSAGANAGAAGSAPVGTISPGSSGEMGPAPSVFMPAGDEASVGAREVPLIEVGGAQLALQVCADNIIRVAYSPDPAFFTRPSLAAAPKRCVADAALVASSDTEVTIRTPRLGVQVERASGRVSFYDPTGAIILAEKADGRTLTPTTLRGEATHNVRQEWQPNPDESLYGLGQHQDGLLDIKGYDIDLKQYNTQVTVPFLVSSRGYGILWDNTSFSRFGDVRPFAAIPGAEGLYSAAGDGEVGSAAGSLDWQGSVQVPETGDYLFQTYASGDIKLWVNDELVIDHWRQGWLPYTELARVRLEAGQTVRLRLAWTSDIGVNALRLLWKTPTAEPSTSLWSEVAAGLDYYFVYGPDLDDVIGGYRQVTGPAPMMPSWAFGLWQSRERYQTQQASLDVAAGFRSRNIPVDVLVQDWQYWTIDSWGSHAFDPVRFPDPDGWISAMRDTYHARIMISVWPKFYPGTANFDELRGRFPRLPVHFLRCLQSRGARHVLGTDAP